MTDLAHRSNRKISAGSSRPLGATLMREGVNFSLYSCFGQEVFLLLFETPEGEPTDIIKIEFKTEHIWHVFVHGIGAGQLYGYKIRGDYDPPSGFWFNEHKLLIDPYAKAVTGKCQNSDGLLLPYRLESSKRQFVIDARDNSHLMPKSIVIDDTFDWRGDQHPEIPLDELLIYEVHVKGFTAHHSSGVKYPGTYLGMIEKIPYLKELGVNAVELLPVHEFYIRDSLIDKGLTEYWGYNTIGFFAPESSYGGDDPVKEFKMLVRELHRAGIEVILDVVYNHTGEGNERGPSVCFKGIDNPTYYELLKPTHGFFQHYVDDTGCGNTIQAENPAVRGLILDSLRYWTGIMHVDGFRFDLATILGRVGGSFDVNSPLFEEIRRDPILKQVKLIAEPWDLTTYQAGNFPSGWSEWNGKYRDSARRFIRGDDWQVREITWRITGSADLFKDDGRSPSNSINFITAHDGFTLHDLFAYQAKRNDANFESNNDGSNDNLSWNYGAEGETQDANILRLRSQLTKNALCLLFFSAGTPLLLGGDEFSRTQRGNNNAYCQDNELSWYNWELVKKKSDIWIFCQKAIAFRKRHAVLRRKRFFTGEDLDADRVPDISWFGENLAKPNWDDPALKLLCYQLDGKECLSQPEDYYLFMIFNSDDRAHLIELPRHQEKVWYRVVDTTLIKGQDFLLQGHEIRIEPKYFYQANPRSVVVLKSQ